MAGGDVYGVLQDMRQAAEELFDKPKRREQAEEHVRLLEHLHIHGATHKSNPNLTANAILSRAQGFLMEFNDTGFMYDDDPSPS